MRHEVAQFEAVIPVVDALEQGKDPAPYCIEIHPTDFCNQACSYCFHGGNGEDTTRRSEILSAVEYNDLFDQAEAMGVQEVSISGGGEPFLYHDMPAILTKLAASPLRTRIVTNGNFLPETVLPGLLKADEIRFSVDAVNPSTYNNMRGMRGGNLLGRTLTNIRKLVTARDATNSELNIGATFLLGSQNVPEMMAFAELLLDEIGIDTITYKHDIYGQVTPDSDQLAVTMMTAIQEKYGDKVEFRPAVDRDQIAGACAVPYFKVAFNPYGELFSCCLGSQPGETNGSAFGSLRIAGSLGSVWEQSAGIRADMIQRGVNCTDCNVSDQHLNVLARERLAPTSNAGRVLLPLIVRN